MSLEGPKCVAFRSEKTGSYLRYVHESNKPFMELSGEDCITPYTRFYVETSKEHQGLVHIRCCYNNTYWVAKEKQQEDGGGWIITTVDEPEDDLSNPSCTLFNLVPADPLPLLPAMEDDDDSPPHSVRFLHAGLGKQVDLQSEAGKDSKNIDLNAYTLLNFSGQEKQLPGHVVFKGDNGKYLSGQVIQRSNYLAFALDDMADATVINTTHYMSNGNVRIRNIHFGMFWRRSPNWIWADSSDWGSGNRDTVFAVQKVGDVFAFRNMGNNSFCKRLTDQGKTSCLNAAVNTITIEARIEVEEPVFSREIYDVNYDLSKARIHDRKVVAMDTSGGDNNSNANDRIKLSFTYTVTEISTWDSTLSWMLGVETKIKAGVPLIADGSVTIKSEFTGSYSWGSSIEKSTSRQSEYDADVPPHTRVTVTMLAEQASCDVPFSYKQRDLMYDGRTVIQTKNDGLYIGANSFHFRFLHAGLGKQVDLQSEAGKDSKNIDLNAYTLVDFSGQEKQLPRHVVFKGDNGKYLSGQVIQRSNYLAFALDDMADATVINTTHYMSNGNVRIRNIHFGMFWRRSPNWIWADSSDWGSGNRDTVFAVQKVRDVFALRNMGNNSFCKRLTDEGKTSCLNAAVKNITIEARIEVEEPVFSREIYDVNYDLSKARIHDRKVVAMDTSGGDNNSNANDRIKLSFTYTVTEISTWDSTLSWMLGVETKIKAGVPLIADGSVTIKSEFTGSYSWGSSIEKSTSRQSEYDADVPPHTRVTVTMLAEQASCDVPFSYKQRDLMYDGRTVIQTKHDGLYIGANSFHFRFDRRDEKLTDIIDNTEASMNA
ncbi:hypothetical protein GUJ93_ZPchr0011g27735 [Zizania palustris]|uniref:Agglutinin domain-containing protein n=1 Tax=Zizania palustris TaxID=103762 RepID=A0A8J5WKB5_ZIZPA|nr:hypothetical protein GUJ93_ZPchr0011g27735 [Zizania palustris]